MNNQPLTEEDIDAIAEKAARKALDIVYAEVGRSVLKKIAWIAGAATIGLFMWLSGKHLLPA